MDTHSLDSLASHQLVCVTHPDGPNGQVSELGHANSCSLHGYEGRSWHDYEWSQTLHVEPGKLS